MLVLYPSLSSGNRRLPSGFIAFRILDRVDPPSSQVCSSQRLSVASEHDVCTSACHVSCHRYCTSTTRHCDDCGLALVVLSIEHLMGHAIFLKHCRKLFRFINASCSDQNWLTGLMTVNNVLENRSEFGSRSSVDQVRIVLADHFAVCRDRNDTKAVNLAELGSLGHRGTGHTAQFVIQSEKVL